MSSLGHALVPASPKRLRKNLASVDFHGGKLRQQLSPGIRESNGTPLQSSCLETPMDRGAWWAAVHRVAKSQTRLSDFTFTFHFHALEKEMATHSSVLAWRIPGTGSLVTAVYGVVQSRTQLKRLSSSSKITHSSDLPQLEPGYIFFLPF